MFRLFRFPFLRRELCKDGKFLSTNQHTFAHSARRGVLYTPSRCCCIPVSSVCYFQFKYDGFRWLAYAAIVGYRLGVAFPDTFHGHVDGCLPLRTISCFVVALFISYLCISVPKYPGILGLNLLCLSGYTLLAASYDVAECTECG